MFWHLTKSFELVYNVGWSNIVNKKITAHQAAAILGYSVEHVHRLLRLGAMNGEKFNRVWIIDYKEVERIKREQTDGGRFYHGKTTGPRQ